MNKVVAMDEAIKVIKNGDTILVGGFGPRGYPGRVMRNIVKNRTSTGTEYDLEDLTIVFNGLNRFYMNTMEKLLERSGSKLITTFVRNSIGETMYKEGKVELVPQGTFAERLRAGGAGIPGFYTPVGVGTLVAEGKEVKNFDGKDYLLERAITGDVALISATKVDLQGNCYLRAATKQFSALMPAAAKYTIVETNEIVDVGQIDPELITIPGIMIDAIVYVG